MGIETFQSVVPHDLVAQSQTVGSDQPQRLVVPDEQLPVIAVETVGIDLVLGAFADLAERPFAQRGDHQHHVRDLLRRSAINLITARNEQPIMSPQAFQLAAKQFHVDVTANLIGHLPRRTALGPAGTPSTGRLQVLDRSAQVTVISRFGKILGLFGQDRRSDAQRHRTARFVDQLAR